MKELVLKKIKGKKVLILGFGIEGQSTLHHLKEVRGYSEIAIADKIPPKENIKTYSGEKYLDNLEDYEIVFKSPGVVLPKDRREYKTEITSQVEVFLERYREKIIGVTGTKGKSTTSSLIYQILREGEINVVFGGNIGTPVWDLEVGEDTVIVLELSCHQLEYCGFSPNRALFLNLYEEHLDHYGTFEKYFQAKKNIYLHQSAEDILYGNEKILPSEDEKHGRIIVPDIKKLPFSSLKEINPKLRGEHTLSNISFAYSVASDFKVPDEFFLRALKKFSPLPHRLEFIGEKHGIDFYDDSISTASESAISAVKSIENAETLLLGGMDRGIDYSELVNFLLKTKLNIICMYKSGERLYSMFSDKTKINPKVFYEPDLESAVRKAVEVTRKGKAVILSPASASYGYFKNFEERGERFRSIIFENL